MCAAQETKRIKSAELILLWARSDCGPSATSADGSWDGDFRTCSRSSPAHHPWFYEFTALEEVQDFSLRLNVRLNMALGRAQSRMPSQHLQAVRRVCDRG